MDMRKKIDFYINTILYNTINIILLKFNTNIRCDIIYKNWYDDNNFYKEKDYLIITFQNLKSTKNKYIYDVIKQTVIFKYDYKRKTLQRN